MSTVNLRSFRQIVIRHKRGMRSFLSRVEKMPPRGIEQLKQSADLDVWQRTDCLECANCCKTMSPTYTREDIRRISKHLGMTQSAFREKWLYKDKSGDWMNVKQPCQFLDLRTNLCSIYAVRPGDCAGFPHHTRKKMNADYMHIFKQNLEYCPATFRLVESMMEKLNGRQ